MSVPTDSQVSRKMHSGGGPPVFSRNYQICLASASTPMASRRSVFHKTFCHWKGPTVCDKVKSQYIYLDSITALTTINSGINGANKVEIHITCKLNSCTEPIMFIWVLCHYNIYGTDQAVLLLKSASELEIFLVPRLVLPFFGEEIVISSAGKVSGPTWLSWISSRHQLQTGRLPIRRTEEEVVLVRLRTNSTFTTHLQPHLTRYFSARCLTCKDQIPIEHLIIKRNTFITWSNGKRSTLCKEKHRIQHKKNILHENKIM